jgi:hypothetical protein
LRGRASDALPTLNTNSSQLISTGRAPACAAESPKLSPLGAAPRRLASFYLRFSIYDLPVYTPGYRQHTWLVNRKSSRGRGRQAMPLPCKQADAGALPADSTTFTIADFGFRIADRRGGLIGHGTLLFMGITQSKIGNDRCGELDQSTERSLINSCRWVQLPPPLPISDFGFQITDCKSARPDAREAAQQARNPKSPIANRQFIGRCSGCRPVNPVSKNEPEATTGALPAPPTNFRIRSSISGATRCLREG